MGAWDYDAFGNDTACDWAYELENYDDLTLVVTALTAARSEQEYLDADLACEALAACEVLARLQGRWGKRSPYTETADKWVSSHTMAVPGDVVALAHAAIERILGNNSELRELWGEESLEDWLTAVNELRSRLVA